MVLFEFAIAMEIALIWLLGIKWLFCCSILVHSDVGRIFYIVGLSFEFRNNKNNEREKKTFLD